MAKYKIVWDDIIAEDNLEFEKTLLAHKGLEEFETIRVSNANKSYFLEQAKDADAICAYIDLDKKDYEKLERCKIIAAPALGIDPFDINGATEADICICNAPHYCIEEVAIHTVSLALDSFRRISRQDRHLRKGNWDWDERGIQHRISTCTWGFVSFGGIAQKVSQQIKGFGMNMIGYDPFLQDDSFEKNGVKRIDYLEEVLSSSDIISVHTPLTKNTHHMLNHEILTKINPGAVLVVTGRGGVVDEDALKKVIEDGKISSVGLDVIEDETTFKSVLRDMPEVTITPHCAYYSEESTYELRETNLMQMIDVIKYNKKPSYLVNPDVASALNLE